MCLGTLPITVRRQPAPATTGDRTSFRTPVLDGCPMARVARAADPASMGLRGLNWSVGAGGSLIAAGLCAAALVGGLIGFDAWPGGSAGADPGTLSVPAARAASEPAGEVVSFESVASPAPTAIAPASPTAPDRSIPRRERAVGRSAPPTGAPARPAPAPAAPPTPSPAPAPASQRDSPPAAPRPPAPTPLPVPTPPPVTPAPPPVRGVVEEARRVVEPVVQALPAPVQEPVDGVVDAVEDALPPLLP
jgi:hypothetical protein